MRDIIWDMSIRWFDHGCKTKRDYALSMSWYFLLLYEATKE